MWRWCVFLDFSKALPIIKSAVSDNSEAPRPQTPFPILLAHLCDYPCCGFSPQHSWTHHSSPPTTLSINVGLEHTSVLQNSAKVLFRSLLGNILNKRAEGIVKMTRSGTWFQLSG